jgi:hypothetical protein
MKRDDSSTRRMTGCPTRKRDCVCLLETPKKVLTRYETTRMILLLINDRAKVKKTFPVAH